MMKLNIQLFGHTGETDNYDLPQFVGTDKPTWLGDFNSAMSAIDTAIAGNASSISSLDTRVTNAEGVASQASSDVSSLSSTVSSLSSTVSSVQSTANNAQSTATSALNTANSAQSTATTADGKADTNATAITTLGGRVDDLEPITLYNDATGSSSNITLSETASDFTYLEIFYHTDTSDGINSLKVYSPDGKSVNIRGNYDNGTYLYEWTEIAVISGTTITRGTQARWRFATSGSPTRTTGATVNIYIDRVLGYTTKNKTVGN